MRLSGTAICGPVLRSASCTALFFTALLISWLVDSPFSPTPSAHFHTIFCLLSALFIINLSLLRTHNTFFMPFCNLIYTIRACNAPAAPAWWACACLLAVLCCDAPFAAFACVYIFSFALSFCRNSETRNWMMTTEAILILTSVFHHLCIPCSTNVCLPTVSWFFCLFCCHNK